MPDPTPTIPTDEAARGIVDSISGFVAQNVTVRRNPIRQEYPDQDGAIAAGKVYDTRFDLTCSVYTSGSSRDTAPFGDGDVATFRGEAWAVDTCERADAYNDVVKWNVTAHRHVKGSRKYPAATASSGT